jgi:hypothetical protein
MTLSSHTRLEREVESKVEPDAVGLSMQGISKWKLKRPKECAYYLAYHLAALQVKEFEVEDV